MSCKKINELFKEKKKDFYFINKFNKNLNTESSISLYSQTDGHAFENINTVDLIDLEHPGTKSKIEKNKESLFKNSKSLSNLKFNEENQKRQKFLAPIGYACLEPGNLSIKNIRNYEKKVYNYSINTQKNISEEDLLKSGILNDILQKHSEIISHEAVNSLNDKNLFEIKIKCIELCKDQEGSRFVQEKIAEWNETKITFLLKIIYEYFFELSTSVFGNYVIQKIFSKITFDQLLLIHEKINKSFIALSLNIFGFRVIQIYIETIIKYKKEFKEEYEKELSKNLDDKNKDKANDMSKNNKKIYQSKNKKQSLSYVISIILDTSVKNFEEMVVSPFANHVIQKCFELDTKNILLKELLKNPCKYANEKYGCRIIQKLLNDAEENIQTNKFNTICNNTSNTICNNGILKDNTNINTANGNKNIKNNNTVNNNNIYKNQSVRTACSEITLLIASSGSISEKLKLITELKFELLNNASFLISDQYGNYVIQLLICDTGFKDLLMDYIIEHCRELSVCKFSSNIIEKYVATADQSIIDRFFDSFNVKIEGKEFLLEMMKDGCANYVIQTLYSKVSDKQKRVIQKIIKDNYTELQNISYFKSMYNKMLNGKNK